MSIQPELQPNSAVLPVIREPRIWHPVIVAGALRKVMHDLFDSYHPELHYMRGPGPRWREKHAHDSESAWWAEHGRG